MEPAKGFDQRDNIALEKLSGTDLCESTAIARACWPASMFAEPMHQALLSQTEARHGSLACAGVCTA